MMPELMDYAIVIALGLLVGAGELVSRYRDAPMQALRTPPALLYVLLNLLASVAVLALSRRFGWTFGTSQDQTFADNPQLLQALVAGTASMALLRSSLFTVRLGNEDIPIGVVTCVQPLLDIADRAVDRARAKQRMHVVQEIMEGLSATRAGTALTGLCKKLMQNLTRDESEHLASEVNSISADSDLSDWDKCIQIGLVLMRYVGVDVLREAATAMRSSDEKEGARTLSPA